MTLPPHESIELPAKVADLEHLVDRYAYRNHCRREVAIFAVAGRMYVCRDEDAEQLRVALEMEP